jgi:primosomal protein N' (replication factor Y)
VLGPPVSRDEALVLTPEQAAAHARIHESIDVRAAKSYLLHGVTGSGKTEVYLRAVADALALGRQALVLVPEITLTHQIVARLRARFGDALAVLHSGLRPGERLEQWLRLRAGDTPIAVGARSALFAPLENLGVIVIDEEHDGAYKNDEGFRYHARRLASLRAEQSGCPLILGSATPALETRHRAESGEIERLVLRSRIADRPLPRVAIVDLAEERRTTARGRKLIVSRPLLRALRETLDREGQSILFLNRRGFSTRIFCFDCGYAERCQDCDVALVYHAAEHLLCCHYCDFAKPPPESCGGCGNPDTALLGTGTERLEEEVHILLPEARVARLDRDTARRRGHVEQVLAGLHQREIDIVIGTQMVAKGHDFPGVQLVGVIAADIGLHMPDFRAAERTFQLLTQVAGRAGRASVPGRVVLQTFVPDHYAIRPVRKHDYEGFYREEIAHRRALHYPPFGHITLVIVSGPEDEETLKAAEALAGAAGGLARRADPDTLAPGAPAACEVLGPVPAPLRRLRGRHRYQVLVKGVDGAAVRQTSERLQQASKRLPSGIQVTVDVDPTSML